MATSFEKAIHLLTEAEVEFVVIGGFSAILHGSVHVTNDLDVLFSRKAANLRRLAQALAPYHPPAGSACGFAVSLGRGESPEWRRYLC